MLSSYFWIRRILMHILWKNFFKYNEVDQTPSLNKMCLWNTNAPESDKFLLTAMP
jgi:hypothetical protein